MSLFVLNEVCWPLVERLSKTDVNIHISMHVCCPFIYMCGAEVLRAPLDPHIRDCFVILIICIFYTTLDFLQVSNHSHNSLGMLWFSQTVVYFRMNIWIIKLKMGRKITLKHKFCKTELLIVIEIPNLTPVWFLSRNIQHSSSDGETKRHCTNSFYVVICQ